MYIYSKIHGIVGTLRRKSGGGGGGIVGRNHLRESLRRKSRALTGFSAVLTYFGPTRFLA